MATIILNKAAHTGEILLWGSIACDTEGAPFLRLGRRRAGKVNEERDSKKYHGTDSVFCAFAKIVEKSVMNAPIAVAVSAQRCKRTSP